MDWDDLEPRKKALPPTNLDAMGIDELNAYIGELEAEIERTRAVIAAKQGARAGAESFFKK